MTRRNVITCLTCGEVVESTYRHDYRECACPGPTRVMVDGGNAYHRRGWGPQARWTESDDGTGPVYPEAHFAVPDPEPLVFGEELYD